MAAVENRFYEGSVLADRDGPVVFPCGEASYTGGDPVDPRIGAYIIKNAWMELPMEDHHQSAKDRHLYHTEDLLVCTPSYRNSTGVASCALKSMALVGQHVMHKTTRQPRWIWSTLEHRLNAPDCTELPPSGDMMGSGPSKACPASIDRSYHFFPQACSEDGTDPGACQVCNTPPVSNADGCTNPNVTTDNVSWCLDLPPDPVAGTSRTCRQVSVAEYYASSQILNENCARRLGKRSVWANYQLISTMWYNEDFDQCRTVQNPQLTMRNIQRPQVPISGAEEDTRPFLANTSMETDVRSDCMGCHSNAAVNNDQPGTDFNYWLELEVGGEGGRASKRRSYDGLPDWSI